MALATITSLSIQDGQSQHITVMLLDQYGNPIAGATFVLTLGNPAVDSMVVDAGNQGATITGSDVGTDTLTANYAGVTGILPITITPAPSVPTSIAFTSP